MSWRCQKKEIGIPVSSREEEEEVDAQMCPCSKAIESRAHIVGESEMYEEERDVCVRRGDEGNGRMRHGGV